MAETIKFNLEMDNRGAKEALAEIAKIAESASGFINTLASAMNIATKTAGGLSAVLAGPTGLGLALSAISLALQILPHLFSDSTEEMERQKETVRQLKDGYSKLTRESLTYRQEKVKQDLADLEKKHSDKYAKIPTVASYYGMPQNINVLFTEKERYGIDYERYKILKAENDALQQSFEALGDIENIENRLKYNEQTRRDLTKENYKKLVNVKDIQTLTYEQAKDVLNQWIEYDKKLLYGEKRPAEDKSGEAQKKQEVLLKQQEFNAKIKASEDAYQKDLIEAQKKSELASAQLTVKHLQDKKTIYEAYGKDVKAIDAKIKEAEANVSNALEKRASGPIDMKAKPVEQHKLVPPSSIQEKEFGDPQAYAQDWQKGWADREREELDMAEAAELKKADMFANAEEMKTAIHEKYSKYRNNIDKEEAQAQMDAAMGAMSFIGGAVGQNTVLGKAAAVANATMSTYEAAAKALTAGPIFGPILAGVITALGLANVSKILSIETPQMGGYAKGGIVVGEAGPEIIAPMQDYASGQALLVQQTVMEARRAMSSFQYAQASGDNQTLIRELQKLNSSFEGYSSRPITITKDAVGKIVSKGNSQLRKSRV